MKKHLTTLIAASGFALFSLSSSTLAGPIIIDGTDANDHGGVSAGVNQQGWLYMQKALENLGPLVGNGNKIVVNFGATSGQAGAAINSAFGLSSLVGAGWTKVDIDGAANIASYLAGNIVNGVSLGTTGIMYLPTAGLSGGDMDSTELAAVNAAATAIATFVGGAGVPALGGGLFAMGEDGVGAFDWLSTLIPGIVVTDVGGGGIGTNISLTGAGSTAFPGLTNAQLSGADPWHNYFSGNLGSLSVLGTAPDGGNTRNIILGGGAGTTITPNPPGVPDSGATLAMLGLAFTGIAGLRRKFAV